jgi:LPXTG-motif cell wall-anchored protein
MTLTRRWAVGLPAAGVTAFAALAFAGFTATAATADAASMATRPLVMTTPTTPCTDSPRMKCGYPIENAGRPGGVSPTKIPHRGNPGYGSVSPTTAPPTGPTPTGGTDTVPPTGPTPTGGTDTVPPYVSPTSATARGSGVSPAELPLTGAPMAVTFGLGALLVAAGAGAILYTRRRRSA